MPVTTLPIANGFYRSDSLPVSAQEAVNCYPSPEDAPALAETTVRGCPGLVQVAVTAGGSVRGSGRLDSTPYFVTGSTLFRLNEDFTTDALGAITGSGPVSMAENGTQLMILVPGGDGFIFTTGPDTLVEITDPNFPTNGNPQAVVFLDGYFVCTTDAKKFIISELNDGTSWRAIDFGSAESSPDNTVVPVVFKNQLFIGGDRTIEAFNNIGGAGFPFQRMNLFLDQGIVGNFAVANAPNTFVFVGAGANEMPSVWMLNGNTTEKISTKAIDTLLRELTGTELAAITGWSYGQGGHFFIGFNLVDTTIVYDMSSGLWHERRSRVPTGTNRWSQQPWRARFPIYAYGRTYAGDSVDGRIGEISLDAFEEYGNEIVMTFSTQPFQNNMKPFFVPYLELTVEQGVGNATVPNPKIMMSRSRNGGFSFEDERWRPLGREGEYYRRAIWRRNGKVDRYDIYKFQISDPVKKIGIQLTADVQGSA